MRNMLLSQELSKMEAHERDQQQCTEALEELRAQVGLSSQVFDLREQKASDSETSAHRLLEEDLVNQAWGAFHAARESRASVRVQEAKIFELEHESDGDSIDLPTHESENDDMRGSMRDEGEEPVFTDWKGAP
jgi:hypothetical protein